MSMAFHVYTAMVVVILAMSYFLICPEADSSTQLSTAILIKVDQSGKGDFKKIQDAIDAVPSHNSQHIFISVKPGIYREKIVVPADKPFITISGRKPVNNTIIIGNDFGDIFKSSTFTVFASDFVARHLTIQKQKEPRTKEFSPLNWWHENAKQFPVLFAMARDVLNVPISNVASESAFSQARQQLGDTRHSLGSNALEVLVCLRDWIRSERRNQGKEDLDSPEDEELGDILTHGNPSEFNTPEEGQSVHIDYDELARAMQRI